MKATSAAKLAAERKSQFAAAVEKELRMFVYSLMALLF